MTEEWRQVPGDARLAYQVSSYGRVQSLDRRDSRGRRVAARVLTPKAAGRFGHLAVDLYSNGVFKRRSIHSLVLEAFIGPRPEGMEGCHNNGDPSDNRLDNLRWDTASANRLDSVRHGTHPMALKTNCPRGHQYSLENTYLRAGRRSCRTCQRQRANERNRLVRLNREPNHAY